MTSLLSAISGKFNVSVVLGTVLPVTIFIIAAWILLPDLFPAAIALPFVKDSEIFSLSLVILVVSGLLHHLNIPLIQLYEGYSWGNTALGRWGKYRLRRRFDALETRRQGLPELMAWLGANPPPPPFDASDRDRAVDGASGAEGGVRYALNLDYPPRGAILPTRLGNAIRSFEAYPDRQYGIETINLWPRLVAKIDGAYAKSIEGAKASFDFALNSATLAGTMAALLVAAKIFGWREPFAESEWLETTVEIGLPALLAIWFYRLSIGRAVAWGNTVRSAFDLYRRDLLSQLGYEQTPATNEEEKEMWDDISWKIAQGYEPDVAYSPRPQPKASPAHARSANDVAVKLLRTVEPLGKGRLKVALELSNLDPATEATGVQVRDTVPEGYDFVTNSQQPKGLLQVYGFNPYTFLLTNPIAKSSPATLVYEIEPRPC